MNNYFHLSRPMTTIHEIAQSAPGRRWIALGDGQCQASDASKNTTHKINETSQGRLEVTQASKEALQYVFLQIVARDAQGKAPLDAELITRAAKNMGLIPEKEEPGEVVPFAEVVKSVVAQAVSSQAKLIEKQSFKYYNLHKDALSPLFKSPPDMLSVSQERFAPVSHKADALALAKDQLKRAFEELYGHFQEWRQSSEEQRQLTGPQPVTWLGSFYDRTSAWVAACLPKILHAKFGDWQQRLTGWLTEEIRHVPDQDALDYAAWQQHGLALEETYQQLMSLEQAAKESGAQPEAVFGKEFFPFKEWLQPLAQRAAFLGDYFERIDILEQAYAQANQQEMHLRAGVLDFSAQPYVKLMGEVQALALMAANRRTVAQAQGHQKAVSEIDRKCSYWIDWGVGQMDDLIEPLLAELQAECDESLLHVESILLELAETNAAQLPEKLKQYDEGLYCLNDNTKSVQKLIQTFSGWLADATLPYICRTRIEQELEKVQSLQQLLVERQFKLDELSKQPLISGHKRKLFTKSVDAIRAERHKALTASKRRRLWSHRSFQQIDTPLSEGKTQFLRMFFSYLQLSAPLVQAAMTPVGQRDYNFYLKMMAKASQNRQAVPAHESYDHYLALARGYVGANDEFLNGYDQFLRGQLQVEYNPFVGPQATSAASPMLASGESGLMTQFYQASSSFLPQQAANWLHTFLGLNSADQALANGNAWDNWAQSQLAPQVRDNFFQALGQQFDAFDPASLEKAQETGHPRHVPTGYALYKMYTAMKEATAESAETYRHFRREVDSQPANQLFLQDFDAYFTAHPPANHPVLHGAEECLVTLLENQPAALMLRSHHVTPLPAQGLANASVVSDDVIIPAIATQAQFAAVWPPSVSELHSPFMDGSIKGNVDLGVEDALSSACTSANQQLVQLQKELSGAVEELEALGDAALPPILKRELTAFQQTVRREACQLLRMQAAVHAEDSALTGMETCLRDVGSCEVKVKNLQQQKTALAKAAAAATDDLAATQQLQDLLEMPPYEVDDSLFLHLAGDFFGKGTQLEGMSSAKALNFLRHVITQAASVLQAGTQPASAEQKNKEILFRKLLSQVEQALRIHQHTTSGDIGLLAELLEKELSSLSEGESLFFPGGWVGNPDGHEMYYEFIADGNANYSLRIYNTGAGHSGYHPQATPNYKGQAFTFIETAHITLESIVRPESLRALTELANLPAEYKYNWDADDIYSNWLLSLGGEPSDQYYNQADLRTPQRAGTCTMMSLNAVVRAQIPQSHESRKFHWQMMLKGIVDYTKSNAARLNEEVPRRLLSKNLEEIARISNAAFEEGAITSGELLLANQKLSEIQQQLNTQEAQRLHALAAAAPVLVIAKMDTGSLGSVQYSSTQPDGLVPARNDIPYHFLDLQNWTPAADAIVSDCQKFYTQFETAINQNDPAAAMRDFEKLLRRLPLQGQKGDIWHELSTGDKAAMISILSKTGRLLYQALQLNVVLHPSQVGLVEPKVALAFFKAGTLAYQLLEEPKPPAELFYVEAMRVLADKETPYFQTYDPALQEEMQQINDYWSSLTEESSFPRWTQEEQRSYYAYGRFTDVAAVKQWTNMYISSRKMAERLATYCSSCHDSDPRNLLNICLIDRVAGNPRHIPRDIFPSSFYEARDLMAAVSAIKELPLSHENRLSPLIEPLQSEFMGLITEGHLRRSVLSQASGRYYLGGYEEKQSNAGTNAITTWIHVENAHRLMPSSLSNFLQQHYFDNALIRGKESWIVIKPKADTVYNLQTQKELQKLICHKESQVKETLSYFVAHPELLENPDYQTLFKLLMFQGDLLLKDLRSHNLQHVQYLVNTLAGFTADHYRFYRDTGRLETAAFFLQMHDLFHNFVDHAKTDDAAYISPFVDVRQEIRVILQRQGLSPGEQALFSQTLVLSYQGQDTLSVEEAKELVKAAFYAKVVGGDARNAAIENGRAAQDVFSKLLKDVKKHLKDPQKDDLLKAAYVKAAGAAPRQAAIESELAVQHVFVNLSQAIKEHLEAPQKDGILNAVVHALTGEPRAGTWKLNPAYPYFVSDDGMYALDVRERTLRTEATSVASLPREVADHPLLKKVLGDAIPKLAQRTHPDVYQFAVGDEVCRALVSDGKVLLQKQFTINGQKEWYEYAEKSELRGSDLPPALVKERFHWFSLSEAPELIVTDGVNKSPLYRVEIGRFALVGDIHRLKTNGKDSELLLTGDKSRSAGSLRALLNRFEDSSQVLVWRDATTNLPTLIEFLRFGKSGLRFELKVGKKGAVLECSDFPGFYLAKVQHLPQELPSYLLLENAAGEQKVLIPRQQWEKDIDASSLATEAGRPKRELEGEFITRQRALVYRIDPKDGRLIAESEEARYYLAMMYLWKMDYAAANTYLRSTESAISRLKVEEKEVLKWIVELRNVNSDHDPRALPLSLYAAFLLARDFKKYGHLYASQEVAASVLEGVEGLYTDYLNQLSNIPKGKLKLEEELAILETMPSKNPAMLNRLKDLAPMKGQEQLAFLAQSASLQELIVAATPETPSGAATMEVPHASKKLPLISMPSLEEFVRIPSDAPSSLLRPAVHQFVVEGYRLAKGELQGQPALDVYRQLTGVERSFYSTEDFKFALKMMFPKAEKIESFVLLLFEAVLENPDNVPSGNEFAEAMEDMKSFVPMRRQGRTSFGQRINNLFEYNERIHLRMQSAISTKSQADSELDEIDEDIEDELDESLAGVLRAIPRMRSVLNTDFEQPFRKNHLLDDDEDGSKVEGAKEFLEKKILSPLASYNARTTSHTFENRGNIEFTPQVPLEASLKVRAPESVFAAIDPLYQFSIQPQPGTTKNYPVVTTLDQLGIKRTISPTPTESSKAPMPLYELEQLLQVPTADPVIAKEFKKMADSVHIYGQALSQGDVKYDINAPHQLHLFGSENAEKMIEGQQRLTSLELNLLKLANKAYLDPIKRVQKHLKQLGGGPGPLTMDDLIQLYWRRDATLFHVHNQALSPDELFDLQQGMVEYLEQATYQQHLQRLDKKISEIKEAIEGGTPQAEIDELIKQLASAGGAKRVYNTEDHPEYLVLEYYVDILLRQEQVDNLNVLDMREGKIRNPAQIGVVVDMIMGGGKSTVLMPLLLLLNADGEHLSMGIIPEALLTSVSTWMADSMGHFKHAVRVLECNRHTPLDKQKLKDLLAELKNIRDSRHALLMSSGSMMSLYLKFIEKLNTLAYMPAGSDTVELEQEKAIFSEILALLAEKGYLIIDEADQAFNARLEQLFTEGTPDQFAPQEAKLIGLLYKTLELNPHIKALMRFGFSTGDKSTGVPFQNKLYQAQVVPILIETVISQRFGTSDKQIIHFFDKLSAQELQLIKAFLNDRSDKKAYAYVRGIANQEIKDLLALAREEILMLIPLTGDKLSKQNYGTISSSLISIPFHGSNNPAVRSQHGSPYEAVNFTYQYYLEHGIPADFIKNKLSIWQSAVMLKLKEDPDTKLEEIEAHQQFLAFTDNDPRFSLFGPLSQANALAVKINQSTSKKLAIVREFILPALTTYPRLLNANPQIFGFLANRIMAFTGTPWNEDVFPRGLEVVSKNTVPGLTFGILWQKRQAQIHVIKAPRVDQFVEDLIGKNPALQRANVLIDAGGFARGIGNAAVIRQLMGQPCYQDYEGFVFYDADDQIMIIERGVDEPKLLAHSNLPLEKRFTYYDQKHTTGADIKNSPNATAILTIGKQLISRDLLQSAWRLRGLDKSQKVECVIDEAAVAALKVKLSELLGQPFEEATIRLEHLILLVVHNQALLQGDNNYRSFKHMIRAVLQSEAFAALLDNSLSKAEIQQLFKDVEELFVTKNERSPWALFGTPRESEESSKAIAKDVEALKDSKAFAAFSQNPILARRQMAKTLEQRIDQLQMQAVAVLPAQLTRASKDYGMEVEAQQEKEQEQEKLQEKEQEKETELERETDLPHLRGAHQKIVRKVQAFKDFAPKSINWERSYSPTAQFVSPSMLFKQFPEMEHYADIFDKELISTDNLLPYLNQENYKPFFIAQKSVTDLLVIQDPETGALRCIMLDQLDTYELQQQLANGKNTATVNACFYNFALGPYRQGDNPINFEAMQKNPQFMRLLVQSKFFDGQTHYRPGEIDTLKSWIKEKGVERMHQFFHLILTWKDNNRLAFPSSSIGKLFKELGAYTSF